MVALSPELRAWLVPGLAGMVSSVDGAGQPQLARIWAARPHAEPDVIEIYVQRSASPRLLGAISSSGRAALNLIEVFTYRSRLFKGRCAVAEAAVDVASLDENLAALSRVFHGVGMPLDAAERMLAHSAVPRDMVVLALTVDSVFDQSPKPGAGARL
jgi:hypothetical protein